MKYDATDRFRNPAPDPYQLWLMRYVDQKVGSRRKRQLVDIFGSARGVYEADDDVIRALNLIKGKTLEEFLAFRRDWELEYQYERFLEGSLSLITIDMEGYPAVLKELYDAPYGLFYKGRIPDGVRDGTAAVAGIVGARSCSRYGVVQAREIAEALAAHGYIIASGMARGIDGTAQRACIDAEGETIAVLGCGADVCYPISNWELYDAIAEHGCVMSELEPGTKPLGKFFPARNRIISGLSSLIVVVEARVKSGSLITADFALEQGREIYAVPGRMTDPMSAGCNRLIHQGAHVITDIDTFLEDLDVDASLGRFAPKPDPRAEPLLENDSALVYHCLDFYPRGLEDIISDSGLPRENVLFALLDLIASGLILDLSHNMYIRLR